MTDTLLAGLAFPEGPRWREGRLWFCDMHAHEIVAVDEGGARETMLSWGGRRRASDGCPMVSSSSCRWRIAS